jgi:Fe2+ transport system protein FeoA
MPPPPPIPVPAWRLPRGVPAVVTHVEGGPAVVERLAALGVVPGMALRVVRHGSPMALAVGDARMALGDEWASAIRALPL